MYVDCHVLRTYISSRFHALLRLTGPLSRHAILAAGYLRDVLQQLHPGVHGSMIWRGASWVRQYASHRSSHDF